jgi:hypothetical protein
MDPSEVSSSLLPTNPLVLFLPVVERSSVQQRRRTLDTHLAPSNHPQLQSSSLLNYTMLELTFSFDASLEANRV